MRSAHHRLIAASAFTAILLSTGAALTDPLALAEPDDFPAPVFRQVLPEPVRPPQPLPQANAPEKSAYEVPPHLRRRIVEYRTNEAPGAIIIDTPNTYLYFVLGQGRAIRYGIGVGREGFTWSGVRRIERKEEWPDWIPPAEMIARQPYLPRFMAGGPGNPLGARAMYLAGTLYRIHGTSEPASIGKHVSSGCIRLLNEDAIDLYDRTPVGAKVVVLPDRGRASSPPVAQAPRPEPASERVSQIVPPAIETSFASTRDYSGPPLNYGSSASRLY
jgi:lipoprotein-anchoring transpeptidase ErfK/SrfK